MILFLLIVPLNCTYYIYTFCMIARAISGWFYPGHNPNSDAFHVVKPATRRISFAEYLQMREYQNIQTRMLGANSFPYRNIPVTSKVIFVY